MGFVITITVTVAVVVVVIPIAVVVVVIPTTGDNSAFVGFFVGTTSSVSKRLVGCADQ